MRRTPVLAFAAFLATLAAAPERAGALQISYALPDTGVSFSAPIRWRGAGPAAFGPEGAADDTLTVDVPLVDEPPYEGFPFELPIRPRWQAVLIFTEELSAFTGFALTLNGDPVDWRETWTSTPTREGLFRSYALVTGLPLLRGRNVFTLEVVEDGALGAPATGRIRFSQGAAVEVPLPPAALLLPLGLAALVLRRRA